MCMKHGDEGIRTRCGVHNLTGETRITFGKIRWKKQKFTISALSPNSSSRRHRRDFGSCNMNVTSE
jgi:hypothetical protein